MKRENKGVLIILLLIIALFFINIFEASGQAQLLNANSSGCNWVGNNSYNCSYLKAKLSYLCPVSTYTDKSCGEITGNSKYMKSFQRISKATGESIIASGNYIKKTCLSVSYNKEWVDWPNETIKNNTSNNIKAGNPCIVYAYSVGNESTGYDIYYWVDDGDDTNDPYSIDDQIKPKLVGDAFQLFQIGSDPLRLEKIDISGWDFSGVTSFRRCFAGCTSLKTLNMGTPNLGNLTNIEEMFLNCNNLYSGDWEFQNLIRLWYNVDVNTLRNVNAKAKRFKNIDIQTANGITYRINGDGNFIKPNLGTTSIVIRNTNCTQRTKDIYISWDVLYEHKPDDNPGVRYELEYLEGGKDWINDASDINILTTIPVTNEIADLKSYEYTYTPLSPSTFGGEKQFRIKTIQRDGSYVYTEPFTIIYNEEIVDLPLYYEIIKKCGGEETKYKLYIDDEGNVSLLLKSEENCEYIVPDTTIIECDCFYVSTTSQDYCNAKFINKGVINATNEIVLSNSKNKDTGIQYDCGGIYKGNNITFKGSLPEFKGDFVITNMFTTVSNGQGQDLIINQCATIHAYEGNFQHSGGAMKLYIDGELAVERLIEGNMLHIREGGLLVVGKTDIDPMLKIISYPGSYMSLCYNPTAGIDNLGFCGGTVFYNDGEKVDENGWGLDTNPEKEGDINEVILDGYEWKIQKGENSHTGDYWTSASLAGGDPIRAEKLIAAFHTYQDCLDPTKTYMLLGMDVDPFIPKDKEIYLPYYINPCSDKYFDNRIQIKEMGNKWFRLIDGELIYCEGDNK